MDIPWKRVAATPAHRRATLQTRGLLALRFPLPLPQTETAVRWSPALPPLDVGGLLWYTDGSLRFGPLWELRRTGVAVVVATRAGDLVAVGSATPPPEVRTAAAAELWALLLVARASGRLPAITTDCLSLLTAAATGT